MLIWVCTHSKELLGFLSLEDFSEMTGFEFQRRLKDGVELYRSEQYIFGAVRLPKGRPTLRWSRASGLLQEIAEPDPQA